MRVVLAWLCAAQLARALIPLPTTLMRARGLPPPSTSTAKPLEQHAHALDAWLMDFKSSAVVPPALDAWARNANDLVREVARECAAAAPDAALAAFFFALRCIPYAALVYSAWRLLEGSGTLDELVGPPPALPAEPLWNSSWIPARVWVSGCKRTATAITTYSWMRSLLSRTVHRARWSGLGRLK